MIFATLGTLFLLLGCLAQPEYEIYRIVILLSYFVPFGCHLLEISSFWKRKWNKNVSRGEGRQEGPSERSG